MYTIYTYIYLYLYTHIFHIINHNITASFCNNLLKHLLAAQVVPTLVLRMESSCWWGGHRDRLQGQMAELAFPHRSQHWTQEVSLLSFRAVAATAVAAALSSQPGYPLGSSGPCPAPPHMLCAPGSQASCSRSRSCASWAPPAVPVDLTPCAWTLSPRYLPCTRAWSFVPLDFPVSSKTKSLRISRSYQQSIKPNV